VRSFLFVVVIQLVACDAGPPPAIVINEVMSKNDGTLADSAGNFGDWIELRNLTDEAIALEPYALSDSATTPTPFVSGAVVPAAGFLVAFADDSATGGTAEEPHLPFKLSADNGDVLTLYTADQSVDTLTIPALPADTSYGRTPDDPTGTATVLANPTPGAANVAQ
jgi:hypothetical protein